MNEDFECMKGAVIYGTHSYNEESPTSDDVFQHVKGCKEKGRTWRWQCVRVVLVSLKGKFEVICQLLLLHAPHCMCLRAQLSSPKPSTASTSGAIKRASMAFESCASQPSCCACTPLHVLASATGQLGASCAPSCAPKWQ
jgi:hypothetical protein